MPGKTMTVQGLEVQEVFRMTVSPSAILHIVKVKDEANGADFENSRGIAARYGRPLASKDLSKTEESDLLRGSLREFLGKHHAWVWLGDGKTLYIFQGDLDLHVGETDMPSNQAKYVACLENIVGTKPPVERRA